MERLTQRDLRTLLPFLADLYVLRDLPAFHTNLLATLPQVVPTELTAYTEFDAHTQRLTGTMFPAPTEFAAIGPAFVRHIREHPLFAAYRQGRGSAVKISDFLTQRQFQRTGLYNEVYRQLGMTHQMAKGLPAPAPLVRSLAFFRDRKDFSERDRLLLNLLRSHLNQAYQNAETVTRLHQELELVRQGMEELQQGVIVLTREGRVQTMTTRARQWVGEYFGRAPGGRGRLPETLQRWLRQQQALRAGTDEVPAPRKPLVVEREGKRLTVRLLAEAEQSLLVIEEQQTELPAASLESLGLSRRQTEVLAWVAQGRSNYAIGVVLGISELTVKKHLEHIYAKLGVWSRTEAAARTFAVLTAGRL
jgi:DNA-binding CsgD family transcriptional regulator